MLAPFRPLRQLHPRVTHWRGTLNSPSFPGAPSPPPAAQVAPLRRSSPFGSASPLGYADLLPRSPFASFVPLQRILSSSSSLLFSSRSSAALTTPLLIFTSDCSSGAKEVCVNVISVSVFLPIFQERYRIPVVMQNSKIPSVYVTWAKTRNAKVQLYDVIIGTGCVICTDATSGSFRFTYLDLFM